MQFLPHKQSSTVCWTAGGLAAMAPSCSLLWSIAPGRLSLPLPNWSVCSQRLTSASLTEEVGGATCAGPAPDLPVGSDCQMLAENVVLLSSFLHLVLLPPPLSL